MRRSRPNAQRAKIALSAAIALFVFAPRPAAAEDVELRREPPFDAWCVAPLCPGAPEARPSPMRLPRALTVGGSQGYVEQALARALADALEAAAKEALGPAYDEPLADVADALAATAMRDGERLDRLGGLGAAVMRAALAYELESVIEQDPACPAPRRLDAIYEGLAISAALAPLAFPKRTGRVPAACADTARRAARAVDAAALHALVPPDAQRAAAEAVDEFDHAAAACAGLPAASDAALHAETLGDARRALEAVRAAPPPAAGSDAEAACARAFERLRGIDPARLAPLDARGLARANLRALVSPLRAPADARLAVVARLAANGPGPEDARALVASVTRAAELPPDAPVLADAIAALPRAIVVEDGVATIDPDAILASLAERYAVGEDGKPSLRALLGLAPTPWAFELNGGVPRLALADGLVVADGTIGYAAKNGGVVARGWIDRYDIDTSAGHDDRLHTGGALEAWCVLGSDPRALRVELRASGAFDYFDTTTYPFQDPLTAFNDYDSRMVRASLFAGVRYGAPADRLSLQLLAGGGGEYEDPDTTRFTGKSFILRSDTSLTTQGAARLLVRVRALPQLVGVRLRGDASSFAVTREELTATIPPGGTLTMATVVDRQRELQLHGRLFLDAEVLAFAGFVPAVFGGVDYVEIGGASSVSTLVPSLGAGIVRTSW